MTLTSTGPSGFHLKPLVAVFAATVFAFAAFAVGLWVGNESQPGTPETVDAPAPVATPEFAPEAAPSANWAAFEAGKLDDGPLPPPSPTISEPATSSANVDAYAAGRLDPELAAENPSRYAASGAGSTSANWAAFEAGKYDPEYAAAHPGVTYVVEPRIADGTSANWAAYEAGKLDDTPTEPEPATRSPAVTGGHQEY